MPVSCRSNEASDQSRRGTHPQSLYPKSNAPPGEANDCTTCVERAASCMMVNGRTDRASPLTHTLARRRPAGHCLSRLLFLPLRKGGSGSIERAWVSVVGWRALTDRLQPSVAARPLWPTRGWLERSCRRCSGPIRSPTDGCLPWPLASARSIGASWLGLGRGRSNEGGHIDDSPSLAFRTRHTKRG